jgi:hypothetical protein
MTSPLPALFERGWSLTFTPPRPLKSGLAPAGHLTEMAHLKRALAIRTGDVSPPILCPHRADDADYTSKNTVSRSPCK